MNELDIALAVARSLLRQRREGHELALERVKRAGDRPDLFFEPEHRTAHRKRVYRAAMSRLERAEWDVEEAEAALELLIVGTRPE